MQPPLHNDVDVDKSSIGRGGIAYRHWKRIGFNLHISKAAENGRCQMFHKSRILYDGSSLDN